MAGLLRIGDTRIQVVRKTIRHVHLSVYPPDGHVRITAPKRSTPEAIRLFAISKLGWIRQQQRKLCSQEREPVREYIERESHYVWGRRYLLRIVEGDAAPRIELTARSLQLQVRPETNAKRRRVLLDAWYRNQIRGELPSLLDKWQQRLKVRANHIFVQRMKTRWGGCNPQTRNIRLNTELAKKPRDCLEYVLIHELAHLITRHHDAGFVALMDRWLPHWRAARRRLNYLPIPE